MDLQKYNEIKYLESVVDEQYQALQKINDITITFMKENKSSAQYVKKQKVEKLIRAIQKTLEEI